MSITYSYMQSEHAKEHEEIKNQINNLIHETKSQKIAISILIEENEKLKQLIGELEEKIRHLESNKLISICTDDYYISKVLEEPISFKEMEFK